MAKIRIHELAKELNEGRDAKDNVNSNEIVQFLQERGSDVKNHMSTIEDADADAVRARYGKKAAKTPAAPVEAPAKAEPVKTEPVKTEPAKTEPAKAANRPAPAGQTARPQGQRPVGPDGRPLQRPVGPDGRPMQRPVGPDGRPLQRPVGPDGRPLQRPQGQRPVGPDGRPMQRPVGPDGRPLQRPVGPDGRPLQRPVGPDGRPLQRPQGQRPQTPAGSGQRPSGNRTNPYQNQVFDGRDPADRTAVRKPAKTEVKPEMKPEVKQEVKAEAKPEIKPEIKTEVPVNNTPEVKTAPVETNVQVNDVKPAEVKNDTAEAAPAVSETKETKAPEQPIGPVIRRNVYADANGVVRRPGTPEAAAVEKPRNVYGDRNGQGNRNQGDRQGQRPYGDRNNQGQRPYGDRNNQGDRQGQRPYGDRNNQGQRPFGDRNSQGGNRPFGDRNNQGQRPYGDRNNQGGSFSRGGAAGGFGQGGFNKDKDEQPRRTFTKKPDNRNSADKTIRSEFSNDISKQQRATSYSDGRRDKNKKDRRNGGFEDEPQNIKRKDPNRKGAFQMPVKVVVEENPDEVKTISIPEVITIKELAEKCKQPAASILKKMLLAGKFVNLNSEISFEEAEEIALEYNCIAEKEVPVNMVEELLKEEEEDPATLIKRSPVVCVMGHVDHGKTSLLDAIRSTNVTAREAGGITQHIGAYTVEINGERITFLDTPGHEAFTSMRMRGAKSTDIAILVVAADDGVMPQTVEAINHAKAAGVTIIVAVNKIDKPGANVERVKQELTEHGLVAEDWGGDTVFAPVSAKTHEGLENLLEMVLLTAEVLELKANPDRRARGIVIEAELDKGRGPVARVLIQKGTLNVGDYVAIGAAHGKVRAMIDDKGRRVKTAGPSTPVELLGLDGVPDAGEVIMAVEDEKKAKLISDAFIAQSKEKLLADTKAKLSLDGLFSQIQAGNIKELNLIIKADVMGSVEAIKQSLTKLSNEEVVVRCIHGGVGAINESDVTLASASNAIIIGFNVKPDNAAKDTADREKVEIKLYKVIYNAIEDVEAAMKGMLRPVFQEKVIAHAEIRQLFKASGVGVIAGSFVLDGKIQRGSSVRIYRGEGNLIHEGELKSLKRFKDDVKEVAAGYECGLVFDGFQDFAELDTVEFYIMEEVPRT